MTSKSKSVVGYTLVVVAIAIIALFLYNTLGSRAEHMEGVVVDKVHVEGLSASGETPAGGVRRGKYIVSAVRQEQWIALVRTASGDTVKVHCPQDHYARKQIGDVMHYKKYDGPLMHIEFLSHNEEEEND